MPFRTTVFALFKFLSLKVSHVAHPHCMPIQSPFSFLNLSHASFNVANTAALIILCSVVAFCGILSGCTLAIAFIYTTLTLFTMTSSFMPTFVHLHDNGQQRLDYPLRSDLLLSARSRGTATTSATIKDKKR